MSFIPKNSGSNQGKDTGENETATEEDEEEGGQ